MSGTGPLLEARQLSKHYQVGSPLRGRQVLRAVDGVSLAVWAGETVGLVGESGCGKSTLGRCLLRLTDITDGHVLLEQTDITRAGERALRPLRPRMQMVFQDSYASLNPRRRVGELIAEQLRVHAGPAGRRRPAEIRDRLHELVGMVGLPEAAIERYPHEFSGGQRQRINIARALALSPRLVVADEPVSALDVSIQAQIVNLFMDLQDRLGLTYVFISHDLAVVEAIAHDVVVMQRGRVVESAPAERIFADPQHDYTKLLLGSVPRAAAAKG